MTARVALVVEGQTEQQFVATVLAPYLLQHEVYAQPVGVQTSRTAAGVKHTGGGGRWKHYARDVRRLLGSHFDLVSTMLDFYAYPTDGPGAACCAGPHRPRSCVELREAEMAATFDDRRFRPFVMLHEFETILFAAAVQSGPMGVDDTVRERMRREAATVSNDVELLNDGPTTAPSKRIARCWPDYDKVLAVGALADVDLQLVLDQCPHLASWVEALRATGR